MNTNKKIDWLWIVLVIQSIATLAVSIAALLLTL